MKKILQLVIVEILLSTLVLTVFTGVNVYADSQIKGLESTNSSTSIVCTQPDQTIATPLVLFLFALYWLLVITFFAIVAFLLKRLDETEKKLISQEHTLTEISK